MEMIIAGLVAAGAGLLGQAIGEAFAAGDKARAQQLVEQALAEFGDKLSAPTLEAITAQLGPSRVAEIQADPISQQAQYRALERMMQGAEAGPEDIGFRARMAAGTQAANQQARGINEGLAMQMQARGMGGTGQEYVARAVGQQAAANRAAATGFDAAAEGDQRARQMLMAGAGLAGDIRAQQFGEDRTKAEAADAVERFNAMSRADAAQQDFRNRSALAGDKANMKLQGANVFRGQAAQTVQAGQNIGQGIGYNAAAFGQWLANDQNRRPRIGEQYQYAPGSWGVSG